MRLLLAIFVLALTPVASRAATAYTGDRVDGVAVIDRLDVSDLPAGQTTRLWFRAGDNAVGQAWYVPVIVIKGTRPGPRLLLTAGIHGDELNGIAVIQKLAATLDPKTLVGTVVAVPGLNTPGLLHSTRGFTSGPIGSNGENLNRLMPAPDDPLDTDTGTAAARYDLRLWTRLFSGNADYAIDLHTQGRGMVYPAYVFAQTKEARVLADLLRPDVISMDPGIGGALENMLDAAGVPAVTYEMGGAETFDSALVSRAAGGIRNLMTGKGMLAGSVDTTGPRPFVGNEVSDVGSPRGGWSHVTVALGQDVKAGDTVAVITDTFGDTVAVLKASEAGRVLSITTDPRTEPGDMVVRLIRWSDAMPCKQDGCPVDTAMAKD